MPACQWLVIGSNGSYCRSHDVQDDIQLASGLDKVPTVRGFVPSPLASYPEKPLQQQRRQHILRCDSTLLLIFMEKIEGRYQQKQHVIRQTPNPKRRMLLKNTSLQRNTIVSSTMNPLNPVILLISPIPPIPPIPPILI